MVVQPRLSQAFHVPIIVGSSPQLPVLPVPPPVLPPVVPPALTVKFVGEVATPPAVITVTAPGVAPAGTVTFSDVVVAFFTVAKVLLKKTVLFAGVGLKSVPVMVTVAPGAPEVGVMPVTVGAPMMLFPEGDVTVFPPLSQALIKTAIINNKNIFFIGIS